jgi:excinuclease ABC subunit A
MAATIVAEGTLEDILDQSRQPHRPIISPAAAWSRCRTRAARAIGQEAHRPQGARANNLKDVTASIPLGTFTCITGVSGSGKSSFTIDTLYRRRRAPAQRRAHARRRA